MAMNFIGNNMKKKLFIFALCSPLLMYMPISYRTMIADYPVNDPYYVPNRPKDERIRVEIVVQDDLSDDDVDKIQEVYFDNQRLRLHTSDYLGNRGRFYIKVDPGTYEVKWSVRTKNEWPAVETYSKSVSIPQTAKLYYIQINQEDIQTDIIQ